MNFSCVRPALFVHIVGEALRYLLVIPLCALGLSSGVFDRVAHLTSVPAAYVLLFLGSLLGAVGIAFTVASVLACVIACRSESSWSEGLRRYEEIDTWITGQAAQFGRSGLASVMVVAGMLVYVHTHALTPALAIVLTVTIVELIQMRMFIQQSCA